MHVHIEPKVDIRCLSPYLSTKLSLQLNSEFFFFFCNLRTNLCVVST